MNGLTNKEPQMIPTNRLFAVNVGEYTQKPIIMIRILRNPSSYDWLISYKDYMGVSLNGGTPKSSVLIGFSIINHPFWGTPIFGNTHMYKNQWIIKNPYKPTGVQVSRHKPISTYRHWLIPMGFF